LLMSGFNQPSHTLKPGDTDCWDSIDGGKTWQLRGTVAKRSDAKSNRVHFAVGLTAKGDLLGGEDDGVHESPVGELSGGKSVSGLGCGVFPCFPRPHPPSPSP